MRRRDFLASAAAGLAGLVVGCGGATGRRPSDAGQDEPLYHLCDEPFDYEGWRAGRPPRTPARRPSATPRVPEAWVDVRDRDGTHVWTMPAPGLAPGPHEVIWDGFDCPGLHGIYAPRAR